MPLPFRLTLFSLTVAVAGVLMLISGAFFVQGWSLLTVAVWGMSIAGVGLIGGAFFSLVCAIVAPAWRKRALGMCAGSVLGLGLLALFWKFA